MTIYPEKSSFLATITSVLTNNSSEGGGCGGGGEGGGGREGMKAEIWLLASQLQ